MAATNAERQRRHRERQRARPSGIAQCYVTEVLAILAESITMAERDSTTRPEWLEALLSAQARYEAMSVGAVKVPEGPLAAVDAAFAAAVTRAIGEELAFVAEFG